MSFRVKVNGESVAFLKGTVHSAELEPDTSATPEFYLELKEPGSIEFDVTDGSFEMPHEEQAEWTPLLSIPVAQMPNT